MEIIDNRALMLKVRHPGQITTIIPKSEQVSEHEVLVRWGMEEAKVLHNMGIRAVPSPILGQYDWPGMYTPFEHQKTTSSFLTLHRRAFCFSEQGVGKTASVIWAADYLMNLGVIRRALIVCPMSIMRSAWADDIFSTATHRTVAIAHGTRQTRLKALASDAEFVIINYDGVGTIHKELLADNTIDLIVADEATALKNAQTKRWKIFNTLVRPDTWVWMLTGTPAAQSPADAYGLAKIVDPSGVPKFFGAFRDQVMYKVTKFKWAPKPTAKDTVFKALQPAIRFTKEECLDLPDMLYMDRVVEMTSQQKKYYRDILKAARAEVAGERISAVNAAAMLIKLLQVATGSAYTDSGDTIEFDASARMGALLEVIEETSHKVVVFAPFRHTITALNEFLTSKGIDNEVIHGGVGGSARAGIFRAFQSGKSPRVLVIQPQAAAHGVTLTAADTIVWYAPTTSVEIYLQGNARIHRAGQDKRCTVIHLRGSGVEDRLYKLLRSNTTEHEAITELYQSVLDDEIV